MQEKLFDSLTSILTSLDNCIGETVLDYIKGITEDEILKLISNNQPFKENLLEGMKVIVAKHYTKLFFDYYKKPLSFDIDLKSNNDIYDLESQPLELTAPTPDSELNFFVNAFFRRVKHLKNPNGFQTRLKKYTNIKLIINMSPPSQNAKDLGGFNQFGEDEVLINKGTKFIVQDVQIVNNVKIITLTERI